MWRLNWCSLIQNSQAYIVGHLYKQFWMYDLLGWFLIRMLGRWVENNCLDMFLIADKQYWIWNQNVLIINNFLLTVNCSFLASLVDVTVFDQCLLQQHTDLPWNGRRGTKEAALYIILFAIIMGFINTNVWKRTYKRSLSSFFPNKHSDL